MSRYIGRCRLDMQAGSVSVAIKLKATVWKLVFVQHVASE
jgi:hypothetical protein